MPKIVIYCTCAILICAVFPFPYAYYQFVRLVACGVFGYGAYITHQNGESFLPWLLGGIALLFNPLFPVYLDRATWSIFDVIAAVILLLNIKRITAQDHY